MSHSRVIMLIVTWPFENPVKKKQKQQRKVQIHIVTFDHWHVEIPELQTFVHFIRHTRGTMLSAVDFYNRCLVALSTSLFVIFLKETMESKCHTWNIVLKCYFSYTCLFHFPPSRVKSPKIISRHQIWSLRLWTWCLDSEPDVTKHEFRQHSQQHSSLNENQGNSESHLSFADALWGRLVAESSMESSCGLHVAPVADWVNHSRTPNVTCLQQFCQS